jgi:hypothetical protein
MLLAVLACEIALRATNQRDAARFYLPDAQRGWALRPNQEGWSREENVVWVRINSDGLRDREHPAAAPPGTVRVAVLGDSYMMAVNVPQEKTFTSFLESRLTGCVQGTGRVAEVMNFGVGGYGTAQELLTYRSHVTNYRPDVVVLAVYTSNDLFNNHPGLNESNHDPTPYFALRGDMLVLNAPTAVDPYAGEPWFRRLRIAVTERLRTADLLYRGWATLRPAVKEEEEELRPDIAGGLGSEEIYRPPSTPAIAEAWRVTEALFLTLAREVAASGAEFWIVTLSNAQQVHPELAARRALADGLGVDDLFYPDRRIRDFAAANGIPAVMLAEPLAEYSAASGAFLNGGLSPEMPAGQGHWNVTTNTLAAGIVGDRLCSGSPHFSSGLVP